MGRQAFLTRIALGRSAFEPLEQNQSSEDQVDVFRQCDLEEDPSDQDGIHTQSTSQQIDSPIDYIQQYDDRGYPYDPEAQARASQMRQAQNDVLAAVGVVKRRDDREKEARSIADRLAAARLKLEDIVGTTLDTFPYPLDISSFDIVESERRSLGNYAFFMAGLPAYVFYHLVVEGVEQCVELLTKYLMRLLEATVHSRAQRNQCTTYISNLGTA
ncbi:MAG: hypothetical protein Q9165_002050 [Trypethelium subeluteriae]